MFCTFTVQFEILRLALWFALCFGLFLVKLVLPVADYSE